jgi:hypothetical protein
MAQVDLHTDMREALREHLTSTQMDFHVLLDGLTNADLGRRSGNPAWTVGAVLTHLVWGLELLPREVASARKSRGMYNLPPILRDVLNAWVTRLAARGQTLESLRQRYDAAFAAAIATLDGVGDNEWQLGARFWSEGFRDIAGLYAGPVDHLAEHAGDVRRAVPRFTDVARTTH